LPLSAHKEKALRDLAGRYCDFLAGDGREIPPWDVCHTASVRRSHHAHRLAITFQSYGDAIAKLHSFLSGAA
jgi:acyl transferase domain-containing protein